MFGISLKLELKSETNLVYKLRENILSITNKLLRKKRCGRSKYPLPATLQESQRESSIKLHQKMFTNRAIVDKLIVPLNISAMLFISGVIVYIKPMVFMKIEIIVTLIAICLAFI